MNRGLTTVSLALGASGEIVGRLVADVTLTGVVGLLWGAVVKRAKPAAGSSVGVSSMAALGGVEAEVSFRTLIGGVEQGDEGNVVVIVVGFFGP